MFKNLMITLILGSLLVVFTSAQAQWGAQKKAAPAAKVEEKPEPIKLDGKQWEVQMSLSTGKSTDEPIMDRITFKEGKVVSERYSKEGFGPSNYSISLKEDGVTTVWETMQTSEKGNLFWHGQVRRDSLLMRGVVAERPPKAERTTVSYNFGGTKWREVLGDDLGAVIEGAPEETAEVQAVAKPKDEPKPDKAAEPAKEEPKKKSWWQR